MAQTETKVKKQTLKVAKKKRVKKNVPKVIVRIKSGYNNTIVSITDYEGNVLSQSSGGAVGFKGSKKSTAFAATKAAEDAVAKASRYGIQEAVIIVRGMGMGRQAAVKGIRSGGLKISSLSDYTSIPHGGVTPRKKPRK